MQVERRLRGIPVGSIGYPEVNQFECDPVGCGGIPLATSDRSPKFLGMVTTRVSCILINISNIIAIALQERDITILITDRGSKT